MKVTRTMTIEAEVATEFQRLFPNTASSFCNEQMRLKIASAKGSAEAIDVELLRMDLMEKEKIHSSAGADILTIKEKLNNFKDNAAKAEIVRLEEEKEKLEALTACDGCGFQTQSIQITTPNGLKFCKECFFNEHPKMLEALK